MAQDIEQLQVELSLQIKRYEQSIARMAAKTERSARQVEKRVSKLAKNVEQNLGNIDVGGLERAFAALGVGFSAREILAYADAWNRAVGLIASATGSSVGDATERLQELNDVATRSGTSIDAAASLYARLAGVQNQLGLSSSELTQIVETTTAALALSGASAAEASSAVTQLGQALGSGQLRGDELNSILESSPVIADAIAKSLGVSRSALRDLAAEGKLSSKAVAAALLDANAEITASAAALPKTVSRSFQALQNSVTEFAGTSQITTGVARGLAEAIAFLARNIETAGPAFLIFASGIAAIATGPTLVAGAAGFAKLAGAAFALLAVLTRVGVGATSTAAALRFYAGSSATATTATKALGVALATTPIGLFAVGVSAMSAAFLLFGGRADDAADSAEDLEKQVSAGEAAQASFSKRLRQSGESLEDYARRLGVATSAVEGLVEAQGKADAEIAARGLAARAAQTDNLADAVSNAATKIADATEKQQEFDKATGGGLVLAQSARDTAQGVAELTEALGLSREEAEALAGQLDANAAIALSRYAALTENLRRAVASGDQALAGELLAAILNAANDPAIPEAIRAALQPDASDIAGDFASAFESGVLARVWGPVQVGVDKSTLRGQVDEALRGIDRVDVDDLIDGVDTGLPLRVDTAEGQAAVAALQDEMVRLDRQVEATGENMRAALSVGGAALTEGTRAAILALIDDLEAGRLTSAEFAKQFAEIEVPPAFAPARAEILALAAGSDQARDRIGEASAALRALLFGNYGNSPFKQALDELKRGVTDVDDALDGLSSEELANLDASGIMRINDALAEAREQASGTRSELRALLRAEGLSDEVVAEMDRAIDAFERGDITIVDLRKKLVELGGGIDMSGVLRSLDPVLDRLGLIGRIIRGLSLASRQIDGSAESGETDDRGSSGGGTRSTPFDDAAAAAKRQTDETNRLTAALATLDPLQADFERRTIAMEKEQELLNAAMEQFGQVTPQTAAAIKVMATEYAQAQTAASALNEEQQRLIAAAEEFRTFSQDVAKGFVSDLVRGKSAAESLRGALARVADQLLEISLNNIFGGGGSRGGGFASGLFRFFGGLFGGGRGRGLGIGLPLGGRAMGGPVNRGTPYMVGERGPELFMPNNAGRIIPNHAIKDMGGGGDTVVVNQTVSITTGVQQTVRAEIRQLLPQISDASKMAVLDAKRRGGGYGKRF